MSQYIQDFRAGRPFGDGSDGNLTISSNTTFGAGTSCSGTSGTTSLTLGAAGSFANNDLIIIHQSRGTGAGNWEVNRIVSGGGTTSLTLSSNLSNTYTDSGASQSQAVRLLEYNNVTVDSGKTWTVPSWDGDKGGILAFAARGTTTITGTIAGNGGNGSAGVPSGAGGTGGGYRGGSGYSSTTAGYSGCGEGTSGASASQDTANGNGGAGAYTSGSGHAGDPGSGGGNGTAGGGTSGTGGSTNLTAIVFGGGGGGGSNDGATDQAGGGGSGGALIIIFAKTITITGSISLNGGVGANPNEYGDGGSGAGGSCLIKSQIATLGTTKILASGGAAQGSGYVGGDGRIRLDYSSSYTGTTTPAISAASDGKLLESDAAFIFNLV